MTAWLFHSRRHHHFTCGFPSSDLFEAQGRKLALKPHCPLPGFPPHRLHRALGADVNAVDDNGESAMHGAACKNLPKVIELLADHGAKIDVWNRSNQYDWTSLRIAEGYRVGIL